MSKKRGLIASTFMSWLVIIVFGIGFCTVMFMVISLNDPEVMGKMAKSFHEYGSIFTKFFDYLGEVRNETL